MTYHGDDRIILEDHGVWTGTANGAPSYIFQYTLGEFVKARREANAPTGNVYLLKDGGYCGIAITGIVDTDGQTALVRLSISRNYECPAIRDGSTTRHAVSSLALTVTMSGMKPGIAYSLYRYDSISDIPTGLSTPARPRPPRSGASRSVRARPLCRPSQ